MGYLARTISSKRLTSLVRRPGATLQPRLKFKIHYFDRSIIKTNWKKINIGPLERAGLLVRKIARGSIRRRIKRRGKPSPAGMPPYSRRGGTSPPFKKIYSVPLNLGTSVIVGMEGWFESGGPPVPGLHEHGGYAMRKVFIRGNTRRLKSGRFGKRRVEYRRKLVRYPERPFMWPALRKARNKLPPMWATSIGRSQT